jgi:ribonuclease HII
VGIGLSEVEEIDRLNIHQAGLLAMRRAIESLPEPPEHVLVDARTIPGIPAPQSAFQKGDGINFSIAAASIVAKTHRDQLMEAYDARYPGYGFARHKGYATAAHQSAIARLGPCEIHRSFTFVEELQGAYSQLFYELKRELVAARSAAGLERVEQRIASRREELDPREQRKLRLLLGRRWRAL